MGAAREVEQLVAEFVRLRESGADVTAEGFVADHPLHARELRAALARLEETLSLLPGARQGLPERIGRWRITGEIGRGASGVVLRAEGGGDGEGPVAIKLLPLSTLAHPRALERFRRESEALRRLRHPAIVGVRDVGVAGASPYMVMDLVEGRSLAELLDDARSDSRSAARVVGREDARTALLMVARLARAVGSAHGCGVLHRDLKPQNVMVTPPGEPVLLDFGLVSDAEASTLTRTGDVVGTPRYMAPEQARGQRADRRTDVYGLGAILYEMLTLAPVHAGADTRSTLRSVIQRPVPPLSRRRPDLGGDVHRVVHKALAYRPADRYGSADQLAEDLEACAEGRPAAARPLGLTGRLHSLLHFHRVALTAGAFVVLAAAAATLGLLGVADSRGRARRLRATEDLVALAFYDAPSSDAFHSLVERLKGIDPDHRWLPLLGPDPPGRGAGRPALAEAVVHLRERRWARALRAVEDGFDVARTDLLELAVLARAAARIPGPCRLLDGLVRSPPARDGHPLQETATWAAVTGHRALAAGRHEDAARHYRRGAAIRPEWTRFRLHEARALLASGVSVEDAGDTALRGGGPEALALWARYLDGQGHRSAARAAFRRLLEDGGDPVDTTYRIAASFDRDHRIHDAERVYLEALELDAGHVFSLFNLAWMYAGLCGNPGCQHEHMARMPEARAMLLRALRADGGRSAALAVHVPEVARAAGCEREVLEWIAAETARDPRGATAGRLRTVAAEIRRRMKR